MANSILTKKLAEIKKKYPIGVYDKKGWYRIKIVGHKIEKIDGKELVVTDFYFTNNPNQSKHHAGLYGKHLTNFMNGYRLVKNN